MIDQGRMANSSEVENQSLIVPDSKVSGLSDAFITGQECTLENGDYLSYRWLLCNAHCI